MTEQKHTLPSASSTRHISTLREWDKNPRSITKDGFERLKKQIQKLGQYKPLLITPDGEVLGGNMRLKAYKELGVEDVWVSVVNPKDESQKLEYALSDNDRAGFYDDDLLANLIPDYPDFDWSGYSVDLKEPTNLQDLLDRFKEVEEDEVPEVSNEPAVSEYGKVYQLGRHRLMCGDATKIEDVEKLMNGQKADMVFTDPPYNVDYGNHDNPRLGKDRKIQNDKMSDEDWNVFVDGFITNLLMFNKGVHYICMSGKEWGALQDSFIRLGGHWSTTIIWSKDRFTLGRADYQRQYEPILYGWKEGTDHYWCGDRNQGDIWNIQRPSVNDLHPTMKPVALVAKAVKNSSKTDDIIMDVFGGSGSTLIACEQTNRTCYMMELDEKYVDVVRRRYHRFVTGSEEGWENGTPAIS